MGLSVADLENLEEGMILDMVTEKINDSAEYTVSASQEDMDRF